MSEKFQNQQYEYIYLLNNRELQARIFDPKTKKSSIKNFKNTFIPEVYTLDDSDNSKTSKYKSFDDNKPLKEHTFKYPQQRSTFIHEHHSEKLYGNNSIQQKYIRDKFPDTKASDHTMRTFWIDIETRSTDGVPIPREASQGVTVISIYDNFDETFYILGLKDFTKEYKSKYGKVKFINVKTEVNLLNSFIKLVQVKDPTIICGFNSNAFDLPFLIFRMDKLNLDVSKLSPSKEVLFSNKICKNSKTKVILKRGNPTSELKALTQDGMDYDKVIIKGRILLDYRDLYIKYAFSKLPSISLNNVAIECKLDAKVDHSEFQTFDGFYTSDGYIFPDNPPTEEDELEVYNSQLNYKNNPTLENKILKEQVGYDKFIKYAIRDVEVMLEIDDKIKFIDISKKIAYICGVNVDEVQGTLKQWQSFMYNEAKSQNKILPLEQQYSDSSIIYKAGWAAANPGKKHKWVVSFDFTSLYPSVIRAFNIGTDSMVKPNDIPDELRGLIKKYFTYYSIENFGTSDTKGILDIKYKDDTNDLDEETEYFLSLLDNKDLMSALKKYNMSITANGILHYNNFQGISPRLMGEIFNERKAQKRLSQAKKGELQKIKNKDEYEKVKLEYESADLMSNTLKIFLNSQYGSQALKTNTFSSGKLSTAAITTSGRMLNKLVGYKLSNKLREIVEKDPVVKLTELVQSDTDSLYLTLEYIIKKLYPNKSKEENINFILKFIDKVLQPLIKEAILEVSTSLNIPNPEVLAMENEIVADEFISVALKKYFTRVLVNDGFILKEPEIKIKGLSLISKGIPKKAKELLTPVLDIILDKDEQYLIDYIKESKDKFNNSTPLDISKTMGVTDATSYVPRNGKYMKYDAEKNKYLSAPKQSQAAIAYNKTLKKFNLEKKYNKISNNEKINFLYLRTPNITGFDVVGFKDERFLHDTKLEDYVDFETQFDKNFLKKIEIITDSINWNIHKQTDTLDEW